MNLLLDENVDLALRTELLRHAPSLTVWRVGMLGVPAFGTLDPEILLWCEESDFILVTFNRKSMPVHLQDHLTQGRHIPGILSLSQSLNFGELLDELLLVSKPRCRLSFKTK